MAWTVSVAVLDNTVRLVLGFLQISAINQDKLGITVFVIISMINADVCEERADLLLNLLKLSLCLSYR